MSAKAGGGNHQGRRTPLSLTSGIPRPQTQQQSNQNQHQNRGPTHTNGTQKPEQKNQQKSVDQQQAAGLNEMKEHAPTKSKRDKNQDNGEVASAKPQNDKRTENGHKNSNNEKQHHHHHQQQQQQHQHNGNADKKATQPKDKKPDNEKQTKNDKHEKTEKHDKKSASADKEKLNEKIEKKEKTDAADKKDTPAKAIENDDVIIVEHDDKNPATVKPAEKKETVVVAAADTAPPPAEPPVQVTSSVQQQAGESEQQPMDTSMSEEMAKPAVSVTPKRPLREKKTPTPSKVGDKLNMSPTVLLTRADKAAAMAAAEIQTQLNKTPTKQQNVEEEMETIMVDPSPIKTPVADNPNTDEIAAVVANVSSMHANPAATSTPGKPFLKFTSQSDVPIGGTPDRNTYARSYNQINGRRSIRPISEYTPSKFQSNMQFRESYRRIHTELDASTTTNTSMNVTVGSEIQNNSSFSSFFFRGRKRDRTPSTQSLNVEAQAEAPTSPPKRARMEGFMHLVASPITMLRARFSKATLQNSAPVRLEVNLDGHDEEIDNVQNLSGADDSTPPAAAATNGADAAADNTASEEDITLGQEAGNVTEIPEKVTPIKTAAAAGNADDLDAIEVAAPEAAAGDAMTDAERLDAPIIDANSDDDIQITETPAAVNGKQKNGCAIM